MQNDGTVKSFWRQTIRFGGGQGIWVGERRSQGDEWRKERKVEEEVERENDCVEKGSSVGKGLHPHCNDLSWE